MVDLGYARGPAATDSPGMPSILSVRRALVALALALCGGCARHTTATQWNGHVGPDGEPVFVLTSTYIGLHLGIVLPMVCDTTVDAMVDESTAWIRAHEGSHLRVLETEVDNYWYGVPPLSWLVTPVMTSISIEYRPSAGALARAGVVAPDATNDADPPAQPAR